MIDNMDELDTSYIEIIEEVYLLENNLWKTSKGEVIRIKDMTTSHLENSIKYCKEHRFRMAFIPLLQVELNARKQSKDNIVPELLKGMHFMKHINSKEDLYVCEGRLVIHNLIYNSLRVLSTRH